MALKCQTRKFWINQEPIKTTETVISYTYLCKRHFTRDFIPLN